MTAVKGSPNIPARQTLEFVSKVDGYAGTPADRAPADRTPADTETGRQADGAARDSLKQAVDRLDAMRKLYEVTKDIISHLEIKEVVESILHAAVQGLGGFGADLVLRDCATGTWNIFAEHNKVFDYTGKTFSLEVFGPAIEGVLEGKAIIMNDFGSWLKEHTSFLESFATEEERVFWLSTISLIAPLWKDGKVFGMVSVTDFGAERQYTQEDADFLSLFAGVAGVAFANADMYSKIRRLHTFAV